MCLVTLALSTFVVNAKKSASEYGPENLSSEWINNLFVMISFFMNLFKDGGCRCELELKLMYLRKIAFELRKLN